MSSGPGPDVTAKGYDAFAAFYHRHWSTGYHRWAVAMIEQTLLKRIAPGSRVLDVCCGTGIIARELTQRRFHVSGVDFSLNMLRYARENSPESEFFQADARDFCFDVSFDGAICTFDGLNHILSAEDLLLVFRNVRRSLLSGGVFVADLNLEASYTRDWNVSDVRVTDDSACFVRGAYDAAVQLGRTEVTLFEAGDGGCWLRSDAVMLQRFHPVSGVVELLREAGFASVDALVPAGDFGTGSSFGDTRAVVVGVSVV